MFNFFLSFVIYPCSPTYLSSPIITPHYSSSAPPSTSHYHAVPGPPSKVRPGTPGFSFHVTQCITERIKTSPPVVPHLACGLITLSVLAKATAKLFLVAILLLSFYITLNLHLLFVFAS